MTRRRYRVDTSDLELVFLEASLGYTVDREDLEAVKPPPGANVGQFRAALRKALDQATAHGADGMAGQARALGREWTDAYVDAFPDPNAEQRADAAEARAAVDQIRRF